jgi:glycine dehydrogenase subunit 2
MDARREAPGRAGRDEIAGECEVSEVDVIRHFTRLSQLNFSIDAGLYPLGSCTMKHNPRINEEMARVARARLDPPAAARHQVQGSLEMIWTTRADASARSSACLA